MYFSDSSLQIKIFVVKSIMPSKEQANGRSKPTSRKRKASEVDEQLEAKLKKARVRTAQAVCQKQ